MEQLTKGEEKIMQILWKLKKCFVKDVISEMPDPKPPYNTVSTIVRILEKKGFVSHKAYGRTHEYFPIVSKFAYRKSVFGTFVKNYFDGSYENMVSYMVEDEQMSEAELKEMQEVIEKKIKK